MHAFLALTCYDVYHFRSTVDTTHRCIKPHAALARSTTFASTSSPETQTAPLPQNPSGWLDSLAQTHLASSSSTQTNLTSERLKKKPPLLHFGYLISRSSGQVFVSLAVAVWRNLV